MCSGINVDVIGQIGIDPGSEWQTGGVGTGDATLLRADTALYAAKEGGRGRHVYAPRRPWSSSAWIATRRRPARSSASSFPASG